MEQGETDSSSTSWNTLRTSKASWVRDGLVNVLVMYTSARIKALPDVPAAPELANDEDGRKILAYYASSADMGRFFIAPPGLPSDRVSDLRRAFDQTMRDPDFVAEINKTNSDLEPLSGEELQKLVTEVAQFPKPLIDRMQAILSAGQ